VSWLEVAYPVSASGVILAVCALARREHVRCALWMAPSAIYVYLHVWQGFASSCLLSWIFCLLCMLRAGRFVHGVVHVFKLSVVRRSVALSCCTLSVLATLEGVTTLGASSGSCCLLDNKTECLDIDINQTHLMN